MTDKVQKIKQEIENKRNEYNKIYEITHSDDLESHIAYANKSLLDRLLQFIDSIPEEPSSEDLDYLVISLEETIGTSPHSREVIKEHLQKAAEWQRKKDQETIELAEDHAMLAGMSKMKEEMMKDAIEGWCINDGHILNDIRTLETEKANLKIGDEVKIIIVKTEQK